MKESALLADVGRRMPLGAITILASYCLAAIDTTQPPHGIPELTGVAVTVDTSHHAPSAARPPPAATGPARPAPARSAQRHRHPGVGDQQ